MDRQAHWNSVYAEKLPTEVSWFESEPQVSLDLIKSVAPAGSSVIDVGGGASGLVDRLLEADYGQVAVLDVSAVAIAHAVARLRDRASRVRWIVSDILECKELGQFDVWHDRAVFHFLTDSAQRRQYVDLAACSLRPGGHLIIGTFALDGPEKCSGLPVCRYDAAGLSAELGSRFTLLTELPYLHVTPTKKTQQFLFCIFRRSQS